MRMYGGSTRLPDVHLYTRTCDTFRFQAPVTGLGLRICVLLSMSKALCVLLSMSKALCVLLSMSKALCVT
jgi:hypothetical protein